MNIITDKNKADQGKAPISLVPTGIIWEIAKVRYYGVNVKYPETGRDGWKDIDEERLRDAMLRHCLRYIEDPDGVDEESGLLHISHLACNAAFLIEKIRMRKGEDEEVIYYASNRRYIVDRNGEMKEVDPE